MISLTPNFALASAGPRANTPPPTTPARSIPEINIGPGKFPPILATQAAAIAPAIICPSAPMFHNPIDPAIATARPASPSGTARFRVFAQASASPNDASNIRE